MGRKQHRPVKPQPKLIERAYVYLLDVKKLFDSATAAAWAIIRFVAAVMVLISMLIAMF